MLDTLLQQAPPVFDDQFLRWVERQTDVLLIRFVDLYPTDAEQVRQYARAVHQEVPDELNLYYRNAEPFGLRRDGWAWWHERIERYHTAWLGTMIDRLGMASSKALELIDASPPLWPISCPGTRTDRVGFVWKGNELAVIDIDLKEGGRARPCSIGLRNYFLRAIAMEAVADQEQELEPVDWAKIGRHPSVMALSGWPTSPPFPEHIALTIGRSFEGS